MADVSPITAALFWSKVHIPNDRASCWTWTRTINGNGYGRFRDGLAWVASHRMAYEMLKGPIPDGLHIRHLCHNRLCCNPLHLDVGTPKDNARDAIEAGRFTRGSVNGNSKIDERAATYIRQNPERLKGSELAGKFGISEATVSNIRTGKTWRHVAA